MSSILRVQNLVVEFDTLLGGVGLSITLSFARRVRCSAYWANRQWENGDYAGGPRPGLRQTWR